MNSTLPLIKTDSDFTINWGLDSHGAKMFVNDVTGIEKYSQFYFDVETDEQDNIACIALCPTDKIVYWFPWPTKHRPLLSRLFKSSYLAGQNVKGDIRWLNQNGLKVSIDQVNSDTQLEAYVQCSTRKSLSLKDLTKDILGWSYPKYKALIKDKCVRQLAVQEHPEIYRIGKRGNKLLPLKVTMDKIPDPIRSNYNSMDALAGKTLQNVNRMVMNNSQKRYFKNIELPVMKAIYRMEDKGIKVDVDKLYKLHKEWCNDQAKALEIIKKETKGITFKGQPYNPNSHLQSPKVLTKLGFSRTTADKEVLNSLKDGLPFAMALLNYRQAFKLTSTYSGPILEKALKDPAHRIHATFNQVAFKKAEGKEAGIRTGRLSCSNPNLQNIHAKDEDVEGKEEHHPLRYIFIAEDGHKFVGSDLSQIEYRILAHESEEPALLEAYDKGWDVHAATAAKMFDVSLEDVLKNKELRRKGKTMNFAIVYGAGAGRVSAMMGCTYEEAENFIADYYKKLPFVVQWKQRLLDKARRQGGVETMYGRFIPLDGLRDMEDYIRWGAERQVTDYRIQGSAADMLKDTMIRLDVKHHIVPVLSVHDELLLEPKISDVNRYMEILSYEMENTMKLKVPIVADTKVGNCWAECK